MKITKKTSKFGDFSFKKPKKHFTSSEKPRKKKSLGQHFLRKQSVVDHMINAVTVTPETSIMEIGCGDGFLTESILQQTNCKQLQVYEIDKEWADFVNNKFKDKRLTINVENFLDTILTDLYDRKPWVMLANIPYQITFPIFFKLQKNKMLFTEGVVMIQEEVAQKIVAGKGKKYSATSLFLQHHFEFKLLEKIEPGAFSPPPKVFSRLIYFKPKKKIEIIEQEEEFWAFVKLCFKFPRQTLRNNLRQTHYPWEDLPEEMLKLRAQQYSFHEFIALWEKLRPKT